MRIGVVFPQIESGEDPAFIRDYAQTAEGLGYRHLVTFDHVLGVDIAARPDWTGAYTSGDTFHEPLVLYGFLAAVTTTLELTTGVLILPQRQTALVAKQAAEVDVLSGGRLRLGVGIGWNPVEYEALGVDFANRGRREEEQIEVLRLLWTEPAVTYHGTWHHISGAGINPLPVHRPIPIWIGGSSEATLRRIARLADGWMPQFRPDERGERIVEQVKAYTRQAGRDPAALGMEARLNLKQVPHEHWRRELDAWQRLGATHVAINTVGCGLEAPRDHIRLIEEFAEVAGIADFMAAD